MLLGVWKALTLAGGHIVGTQHATLESHQPLRPSQIADLRLAASKMTGPTRRAFQAEMTLKYCGGNPLLAETIFGWGRHTVGGGSWRKTHRDHVSRAQSAFSGRKRWEDTHPEAAEALSRLAEAHAQQDPTFRTTLAYTRLTAKAALEALGRKAIARGKCPRRVRWPRCSIAWDFGYAKWSKRNHKRRLLRLMQFLLILKKDQEAAASPSVTRLSIDCKATVAHR